MTREIRKIAMLALIAATTFGAAMAKAPQQKVGLVLSGGGAKGIAHIGVIQALEENGIPIDYITGTSMGAIVGGLYAAGYSPQEMMQLILSPGFSYWSTGRIDPDRVYYFTAEEKSPAMLSIPLMDKADSIAADSTAVPASLISPLPMSFAFMQLFAPYDAQCGSNFDNLFVPFRCCASDVAAHHKVVIGKGNFGDAVRSSMSFPIVFQPTEFEGKRLYDGGIYDNFPVDVMTETFAPDFILGIDVSSVDKGPQTSLMDQLDNMVIQTHDYYLDPATGIKIRFDLNRFGLLDFQLAEQIYKIGYDKTMQMMDSIKSRVTARVTPERVSSRRAEFKSHTPQVRFDKVVVTGAPAQEAAYIRDMFRPAPGTDTLGIGRATEAYYRAVSTGKLRDLQPHADYNPATGLFTLRLKASVKNDLKASVGAYVTTSTSSYIYLSAGYSTLTYNSLSAKASAWLGQSYMAAELNGRWNLRSRLPSAIEVQGVFSRENYFHNEKLFFEHNEPSFVHQYEYFGRLKWSCAAGSLAKAEIGVGYGHLHDSFYTPVSMRATDPYRYRTYFNLGQIYANYDTNTLDDYNYPLSGHSYRFTAMAVAGRYRRKAPEGNETVESAKPRWLQAESVTRNYFPMGSHFSLGVETDVMLSTRHLLDDYNTSVVGAPSFRPTPASYNYFNPAFHANSFVGASLIPIYRITDNWSARISFNGFLPLRKIIDKGNGQAGWSKHWLSDPEFLGEFDLCYRLPFATVAGYVNYSSSPSGQWNVGVSFGLFMQAPRFLR